jgi:hypothetical protein
MIKIVCLGTSHTTGSNTYVEPNFEHSYPGLLSKYLDRHNIENYIYNGGQPGVPGDCYPATILNFYNEYKPDMFIIEIPDTDKITLDISPAITGKDIKETKEYHPIYSRQQVLTKDWIRGAQDPDYSYKVNFAKAEAIDYYFKGINKEDVELGNKGQHTTVMNNFYKGFRIDDRIRGQVSGKIDSLKGVVDKKRMHILYSHLYYKSVIADQCDTEVMVYLANILNMINIFKMLNVKFILYSHCEKEYKRNKIFVETYKQVLENPEYWLTGDINFYFRNWAMQKAVEKLPDNPKVAFKNMFADPIHFKLEVYDMFVNDLVGPAVVKKL